MVLKLNVIRSAVFVFSILSYSTSFAASLPALIDNVSAYQRIGVVSVSNITGSTEDAIRLLQEEAQKKGGKYIHITALGTPADSSKWMGVATVYR